MEQKSTKGGIHGRHKGRKMSERDDESASSCPSGPQPTSNSNILLLSFQILLRNKRVFLSIFALTALPLSVLVLSLSLAVRPLLSRIRYLEHLALLAPTRFESRQIWQESRASALSLLRLKTLLLPPSLLLSLAAAVSSVSSAAASTRRIHLFRPLLTSVCAHALQLAYSLAPRTLAALLPSPGLQLAVRLAGSAAEIYLMAVLGLGIVVSVLEERAGWDAIRVGSDLMEGRRVFGWALSGLLVVVTGGIGWAMGGSHNPYDQTAGEDLSKGVNGRVEMVWLNAGQFGWACLYGLVIVWGYVVTTVFYCQCRKRHPPKGETQIEIV